MTRRTLHTASKAAVEASQALSQCHLRISCLLSPSLVLLQFWWQCVLFLPCCRSAATIPSQKTQCLALICSCFLYFTVISLHDVAVTVFILASSLFIFVGTAWHMHYTCNVCETGGVEAAQELSKLGAVFNEELKWDANRNKDRENDMAYMVLKKSIRYLIHRRMEDRHQNDIRLSTRRSKE